MSHGRVVSTGTCLTVDALALAVKKSADVEYTWRGRDQVQNRKLDCLLFVSIGTSTVS